MNAVLAPPADKSAITLAEIAVERERRRRQRERLARLADAGGWREWLQENFPHVCTHPFAPRHVRLWEWFEGLSPGERTPPRVEVWCRGGAKSSSGELGCVYAGTRLTRRFVLYVSGTQDLADRHVQSVASFFEHLGVGRAIGKYGNSKGWRRDQLRTANGFNVAGLGLDVAVRGIKLDEFRPDLIIFDDIDSQTDTPRTVRRKIDAITSAVIPAGSSDCAVLFLQNLIHEDGIVSQLVDGRADFLLDRDVPPIEPAVVGLQVEQVEGEGGAKLYRITGGEATWEGQGLATCERQINDWGLRAFKREAQHEVRGAAGFFFDSNQFAVVDGLPEGETLRMCRGWDIAATEGGGDYTTGVLLAVTKAGVVYVVDAKREQYATEKVRRLIRATALNDRETYGHVTTEIPEDPAAGGIYQADHLREILTRRQEGDLEDWKPLPVHVTKVRNRKAQRALNWQEVVNRGDVKLVRGEWNRTFTEEHRTFREDESHDYDDQIDAAVSAHTFLTKPSATFSIRSLA